MMACPACQGQEARSLSLRQNGQNLWRCRRCHAVHWNAVWPEEDFMNHYRDYYAEAPVNHNVLTNQRYQAVLERMERYLKPGRLADIGCGMGQFLSVAEARGWQGVGLEVSSSACRRLRELKASRGWRFEVLEADVLNVEFPKESTQAAILIEVLEHLPEPAAALRRIREWMVPGGLLYLTTPNFDSLSRLALASHWRAIGREHLCLFNPRSLGSLLIQTGFEPVEMKTKNVDAAGILGRLRGRVPAAGGPDRLAPTESMRQTVEASATLRTLKSTANLFLGATGLGESLEVLAKAV